MIAFFGILQPGSGRRTRSAEAPRKFPFFGAEPDRPEASAPARPPSHPSRTPEEEEAERRFLQLCLPPGP